MARLLTPDKMSDKVADRMSEIRPSESAKEALDAARDALDRARRSIERAADEAPEPASIAARLPRPADILAGVPGAVEVARRVPSLREVRSAAAEVRAAARDTALEAARQTPLRDHPAVRRRPGPLAILGRLGLLSIAAAAVGFVIVNRDRVRRAIEDARDRMTDMAAERGIGSMGSGLPSSESVWSDPGAGDVEVDEILMVETLGSTEPGVAPGGTLPADQPAEDLDAVGWGTQGTPTAPRRLSADVAAMTTPSPSGTAAEGEDEMRPATARSDELGE
ncbi:MAG TPA: hypothetical protein VFS32_02780 [Candidatus Limnocylindrales bacterium]|nr:hypothetical protein [Candidatus Limnocylindrales bacterium]